MAKTREQFIIRIIHVDDLIPMKNEYVFDEKALDVVMTKSRRVLMSETRMFRMFCHDTDVTRTLRRDENGRIARDEEGNKLYDEREVRSAKEFVIVNLNNPKERAHVIKTILKKGFWIKKLDGTWEQVKRVVRSASMVRVGKAFFTTLNPDEVREAISYGADFGESTNIAKMEARYGQATSSTLDIYRYDKDAKWNLRHLNFTFDIMPDYGIVRRHDIKVWDDELRKLKIIKNDEREYNPLDGQGTILPSAAVRIARHLQIISRAEYEYLLGWLELYNQDIRIAYQDNNKEFIKVWEKVPSAFQIRFGLAKGLVVVFPHNLPEFRQDCYGKTYRTKGSAMKFFKEKGEVVIEDGEERHYYDFDRDIMLTDSQWKGNINPKYLMDAEDSDVPMERRMHLEIVLWQKHRYNPNIFMGYQYWQALENIDVKKFAKKAIDELKDTIFTKVEDALAFLGMYDTGNEADEYEEKMSKSAGKIQKVIQLLNENPELLQERWVQEIIRSTREKYIKDMAIGRIPVKGCNPYIVTCPELQFGVKPSLNKGEYYYNNETGKRALFRSPLIHKSEAVVAELVESTYYNGFCRDLLVMNPFDDTLPRMGGADTDGDKVAMVDNQEIVSHITVGLPMLFDEGKSGKKVPNNWEQIRLYDENTVLASILSIGEITNMSTTWKDIVSNPQIMKRLGYTEKMIDNIVCILRFSQGTSIDFAKTGYFFAPPKYALIQKSPHWKPWSEKSAQFGFRGAEVYQSVSQLGQLYNAVHEYMKEKFKEEIKESTRDFTFEFTDNVDFEEMERVKPIIAELERNYRNELRMLHDMELDEEQEREYINALIDKYQYAVASIDADIRSIAAAAYIHTYYESTSKSAKISFPWVVCYEGLLLNISETSTTRLKLRKAYFDGHIDDIPEEIKVYRNESKGEDYYVKVKVPNGTYKTFKRHGQLYVVMPSKSQSKHIQKTIKVPTEKAIMLQINSFTHNQSSAKEIVELLKEHQGIVKIQKVKDRGQAVNSLHAGVWIGDKRVANVNRQQKHTLIPFLQKGACIFQVQDYMDIQPTYIAKKTGEVKEHKYLTLNFIFKEMVEGGILTPSTENPAVYVPYENDGVPYYGEDTGVPYVDNSVEQEPIELEETPILVEDELPESLRCELEEAPILVEDELPESFRLPVYYHFDTQLFNRLNKRASYWNVDVNAEDFRIIGATVEQLDDVYQVVVIREDGKKAKAVVRKNHERKEFEIVDAPANDKFRALVLKIAHYELYKEYVSRKQA